LHWLYQSIPDPPLHSPPQGKDRGFVVGLAFWPGGKEADWGDPINGLQPCNREQQANLVRG